MSIKQSVTVDVSAGSLFLFEQTFTGILDKESSKSHPPDPHLIKTPRHWLFACLSRCATNFAFKSPTSTLLTWFVIFLVWIFLHFTHLILKKNLRVLAVLSSPTSAALACPIPSPWVTSTSDTIVTVRISHHLNPGTITCSNTRTHFVLFAC